VAQVLLVLQFQQFPYKDQSYFGVLVNLCNFLDDAQHSFEVFLVLQHFDEYSLQTDLQEVLGLLRGSMFPLDDLMPDGPAESHHLHDEIENRFRFSGHDEFHPLQFADGLSLCDFGHCFVAQVDDLQRFGQADSDEGLLVGGSGLLRVIFFEYFEEMREIGQLTNLLVEVADENED
jgi:hypothetical protein